MKHSGRQQDPRLTPVAEAAFNCWKAKFHFQYRGRSQQRWYSQLRSEGVHISAERNRTLLEESDTKGLRPA